MVPAIPALGAHLPPSICMYSSSSCFLYLPGLYQFSLALLAVRLSDSPGSDIPSPLLMFISSLQWPHPSGQFVSWFIRFSYLACFSAPPPFFSSVGVYQPCWALAASFLALTLAWPSGFHPVQAVSLLLLWSRIPWGNCEQRKNDAWLHQGAGQSYILAYRLTWLKAVRFTNSIACAVSYSFRPHWSESRPR